MFEYVVVISNLLKEFPIVKQNRKIFTVNNLLNLLIIPLDVTFHYLPLYTENYIPKYNNINYNNGRGMKIYQGI